MKRNTTTHTTQLSFSVPISVQLNETDSIDLIDELLINDYVKDALTHTLQSQARFPSNLGFSRREADIYFQQEAYDKALQIYDKLSDEKHSPKRQLCLAVKLMNCNKLEESETIIQALKANESINISSRAYAILADIAFLKKDYRRMYRWSREAIKRNPFINSFAEKFYIAVELTNNHHKSIPFYETLLDDNPYSTSMWLHLSKCHSKLGFTIQARDCMEMASTIDTIA